MEDKTMNTNYIIYLKAMQKSENTIKSYISHINEMLVIVNKKENEITYSDLLNWQSSLSSNAPSTINLKISAIKSYFKYLKKVGEINNNPAEDLEKVRNNEKVKQYVSSEDMKKIIEKMYTSQGKAIVSLIASTGMRYSEMASITLDQYYNAIHGDRSIVIIGKGNKERTIYVNYSSEKYIEEYLSKNYKNKKGTNKLFVSVDESSLRKSLILAATKANLPYAKNISPHWLRVFWATNAIENGIDLATIRDALGHADISTTSKYVKSCDTKIKNAMIQDFIFN
jgi:site-specific recombinase XerD